MSARACGAVALVVLGVNLWATTDAPVGVFYDDGIYAVLAKSLATGEGYRYLNLPGQPPAVKYPPVYPFLLSVIWRWGPRFPASVAWMKGLNALLMAGTAALLVLYLHRRLRLGAGYAAAVPALTLVTVPMLAVSTPLFSEPLFLVLGLAALYVADRSPLSVGAAALAGVFAGAAFLTRSVGAAVVLGVVFGAFLHGRRQGLAALSSAAAVSAPWVIWVAMNLSGLDPLLRGHYGTYLSWYLEGMAEAPVTTAAAVLRENLRHLRALAAPGAGALPQAAVLISLTLGAAWGAWQMRREIPALVAYLACYSGVILLWPFEPQRFLYLLFPWVLAFVIVTGLHLWRSAAIAVPWVRPALLAAVGLLLVNHLWFQWLGYRARGWEVPQRAAGEALMQIVQWVREETEPSDVIATDGEPLVHLYTGRKTVPNTVFRASTPYTGTGSATGEPDDLLVLLSRSGATVLAVSAAVGPASDLVERLAARRPELLRLVHITAAGGRVFRVESGRLARSGGAGS